MAAGYSPNTTTTTKPLAPLAVCRIWDQFDPQGTDKYPPVASNSPSGPYPDVKSQKTFEKGLLDKTIKQVSTYFLGRAD